MSHYIVSWAKVEVRVSEGRDTQWRITNADHNRDRKRLSMAVKLCERSTGLNFIPKLAKKAVSAGGPLLRPKSRDPKGSDLSRPYGSLVSRIFFQKRWHINFFGV